MSSVVVGATLSPEEATVKTVNMAQVIGIMYRLERDGITRHLVLEDAVTEVVFGRTAYLSQDGHRVFPLRYGPNGVRLCPECREFLQARLEVRREAARRAAIEAASYEPAF